MNARPRVHEYLHHILQAIARIDEYTVDLDESAFLESRLVQDAVVRNFEIIGEACNNVRKRDPAFAAKHADVPWGFAIGMRNVLSHGYFKVDLEAVWRTIQHDLPELATQVRKLVAE